MHGDAVLRITTDGDVRTVVEVEQPSGLGWLPDGSLLISSMTRRVRDALRRDRRSRRTPTSSAFAAHEINDMVRRPNGHAFVGQFGYDLRGGGKPAPAALLRVDPDGSVHEAAPDLRMANGMVITADGATLLVAESSGKAIVGFDLGDDGTLTNRRVWAELPDAPDGIGIDAEDGVWVAGPWPTASSGSSKAARSPTSSRRRAATPSPARSAATRCSCSPRPRSGEREESRAKMSAAVETATVRVPSG